MSQQHDRDILDEFALVRGLSRREAEEWFRSGKVLRRRGLGDIIESMLTLVGITKERVERWTRTAGKPGGCGCEARKRWLNLWGDRVQIAVRNTLIRARDWYVGNSG